MTTFKGNRKYPNAATVTEDPRTHTLALQQIIEALNVGQRRTRDINNSFVRLHELVDVGLIEIVNGQLKLTNAGAAAVSAGATSLADLTDVNLTGLSDGDILVYDSGTGKWVASPLSAAAAMNDLTDVDTTGVADGDVLIYDAGTSTWIPGPQTGGSGGFATAMQFVGEVVVTGAAATDLVFDGLDLDADGQYFIDLMLDNPTAGSMTPSLYYNTDTTATNYDRTILYGSSSGAAASNSNAATLSGALAGEILDMRLHIVRNFDGKARCQYTQARGSTTGLYALMGVHLWRTAANVTKITIRSDVAGGLAVGSYIKVWKLAQVSAATPLTYEAVPHPDAPPVTPDAADDEFDGAALNTSKWSWRNQSTATATLSQGRLLLQASVQSGNSLNILEQSVTGSWKYRTKVALPSVSKTYCIAGLAVINSSTGVIMTPFIADDVNNTHIVQVHKWNSVTSYNSNPYSAANPGLKFPAIAEGMYIEVESDGTTVYFRFSGDGVTFITGYSEAIATFMGAIDRVGVFVTDSSNTSPGLIGSFEWFRKIGGSYAPGTFAANLNGNMASAEALNVTYDNVASGLAATNVQDAIDELTTSVTETESFVYKPSDTDRSSTTTLADDPHLVTTLEANTVYEFEVYLVYTSNNGGAIKWSPNFTGTTSLIKWTSEQGHNNTTSFGSIHTVYYSGTWDAEPATPNFPGWSAGFGSFTGYARVRGLISVGATGGTFSLQWAQNVSNATASTMRSGSFMRVRRADQMSLLTAGPPIGDLKYYAVAFDTDFMQGMFGSHASFTQNGSSVSDTAVFITDHPGILRVASNSGTSASGSAVWQFGSDSVFTAMSSAGRMLPPAAPDYLDFEAILRVDDVVPADVSEWQIGFLDFSGETGACKVMLRGTNTVLDFVTLIVGTGTTSTNITSSGPADNAWFKVKIRVNSTEALCYINDVLVATNTTNLPTTSKRLRPGAFATNNLISISPARTVDVDAMRVTQTYTVGRSG
jgi:hypothetical protein